MDKKKKYIIIVIFAVIGMIIGVTSSLYTWISSNTDVILTIGGVTVNYESGTDITGVSLRPVLDKETGVENNYAIKKNITVSSSKETYFSLYMNADVFEEGLKHESFKWEIYNDGLLLSMGNLRDINEKDRITLINNLKINNMINNLELYIYIDGNMNNPSSMQNSEYKFVLNASVTDQEPEYTNNETGTKVEIDLPHSEVLDNTPGVLVGSGTEKDPYLIESIEDLIALSNNVNNGNTYEGKYISLKQTLNFNSEDSYVDSTNTSMFGDYNGNGVISGIKEEVTSGQGFIPIGIGIDGGRNFAFKGVFKGNNNAIMNLYINYEEGISNYNSSYIGLFGNLQYGVIESVSVSGILNSIHSNIKSSWVGGIVGLSSNSLVKNSINYSFVNAEHTNPSLDTEAAIAYAGGIAGYNVDGEIKNCINKESSLVISKTVNKQSTVGGISAYNTNGKVSECSNYGKISAYSKSETIYAGGIVGLNYNRNSSPIIEKCKNYMDMNLNLNDSIKCNIGGIAGLNKGGTVELSENFGNVNGQSKVNSTVGGITGKCEEKGKIKTSINNGDIDMSYITSGQNKIGGITGYSDACNIEQSVNYGNLIISSNKTIGVGGIVGQQMNSSIVKNSYNVGKINVTSTEKCFVGGVTGYLKTNNLVTNSYNVGNIYGLGTTETNIGGVASTIIDSLTSVTHSHYLNTTANALYGSGDATGITNSGSKTETEMKSSAFVDLLNQGLETPVWLPDTNNINNGYPILSFQNE